MGFNIYCPVVTQLSSACIISFSQSINIFNTVECISTALNKFDRKDISRKSSDFSCNHGFPTVKLVTCEGYDCTLLFYKFNIILPLVSTCKHLHFIISRCVFSYLSMTETEIKIAPVSDVIDADLLFPPSCSGDAW